jgi:uncharacterized protein (TIGR00369 family)
MSDAQHLQAKLDVAQLTQLMDAHFPALQEGSGRLVIEAAGDRSARVRMHQDELMLRPGGTVSGPVMFKLADFAIYMAILAELGATALQAVTTSMNINFLSRPSPSDLIADARLLKLGRRLVVAEVSITSSGSATLVAHATGTYALPKDE